MDWKRLIRNFDYFMFFTIIGLTVFGIMFIYSANLNKPAYLRTEYLKQTLFAIICIIMFFGILSLKPSQISSFTFYFYVICLIGLLISLFFPKVKGQHRFIIMGFSIQFSDFLKIATVLFLSKFYTAYQNEIQSLKVYCKAGLIALIAIGAVIVQPDLGSALVFIPIFFGISFVAGVRKRYLVYTFGLFIAVSFVPLVTTLNSLFFNNENEFVYLIMNYKYIIIIASFFLVTITLCVLAYFDVIKGIAASFKPIFYWYVFFTSFIFVGLMFSYPANKFLKQYQKDRLLIFFNPYADPLNTGYNIIQSMTAIGNGGTAGKGWKQGEMIQNKFLPEQSTDFIFPVIAEEAGYVGSLLLLFLYGLYFFRGLSIAYKAKDTWSTYVCVGLICMMLFHLLENMGMTMGIMPITGIPLPFISYGGSFLITCYLATGLIMNIKLNRSSPY
ncbi:MAG: FtsW/RodA/SpoVE family cell cycle protein [Spirochaetota bacterium]|nr:FtsW/RodA/SpoVE family cell cycle protein [Spirochaetota bacterium]